MGGGQQTNERDRTPERFENAMNRVIAFVGPTSGRLSGPELRRSLGPGPRVDEMSLERQGVSLPLLLNKIGN
jgi:hypothetical protein